MTEIDEKFNNLVNRFNDFIVRLRTDLPIREEDTEMLKEVELEIKNILARNEEYPVLGTPDEYKKIRVITHLDATKSDGTEANHLGEVDWNKLRGENGSNKKNT